MITIDGAYGEGGGQILRYAASLAAATGEKVKIINIRANRPNPGLRPQHLAGLKLLKEICNGDIIGLKIGSKEVILQLKDPKPGKYFYDVGTAGSLTLLMQTLMPVLAISQGVFEIKLTGGTDVKWSPTIDYFIYIFLRNISYFGVKAKIDVIKRGYYPRGGGQILLKVHGVSKLSKVHFERAKITKTTVISICSNLPRHVAERQIKSFKFKLEQLKVGEIKYIVDIYGVDRAIGKGTSIIIFSEMENGVRCGGDAIGERGKPAESVGWDAFQKYLEWYNSSAALDRFMGDMIIPFMFLAGEGSLTVPVLTKHIESALYVSNKLTGIKFSVLREKTHIRLSIGN